jgi:hypothetical protein
MKNWQKGLLVGILQMVLVASLGAKLMWDRARLPRGWAQVTVYDPDLVIRGRYLSFTLNIHAERMPVTADMQRNPRAAGAYRNVHLTSENGQLAANPTEEFTGLSVNAITDGPTGPTGALFPAVLYFIPEHAQFATRRALGEQLWIEVTIPKKGPPRPIRLAIKKGDTFTPLDLR